MQRKKVRFGDVPINGYFWTHGFRMRKTRVNMALEPIYGSSYAVGDDYIVEV